MIVNVNARILGNAFILVQYQEDGKAKDAGFVSWVSFAEWLHEKFRTEKKEAA